MSLKDIFIKKEDDLETILSETKLGEIFDFMAMKLTENQKPVKITVCYLDMKYIITAELIDDFIEELKKVDENTGVIIE